MDMYMLIRVKQFEYKVVSINSNSEVLLLARIMIHRQPNPNHYASNPKHVFEFWRIFKVQKAH